MKERVEAECTVVFEQWTDEVQYHQFLVPVPGSRCEVSIACGYRRCLDFDGKNAPGQDFAILRMGQGFVVGVVADGVSQSFYGDIAAREVGRALLDLLWQGRENPPDEAKVERRLQEIIEPVHCAVLEKPLPFPPDSIPGQAMERTRAKGSQTFFSAFIFDGSRRCLDLYQVGDTLAWIHYPDKPAEPPAVNSGRWASVGYERLGLQKLKRTGVQGMVVHSDGLRRSWAEQLEKPNVSREDFERELAAQAAVDDLSFISLAISERRGDLANPSIPGPPGPPPLPSGDREDKVKEPPITDKPDTSIPKKPAPSQRRATFLRMAAMFASGVLVGALLAYAMADRSASSQRSEAAPPLGNSKPGPASVALRLEAESKEVKKVDFLKERLPDAVKSTKEGEIVARFTIQGAYVSRAEVKGPKEKEVATFTSPPEQTLFARVAGYSEGDQDAAPDGPSGRQTPVIVSLFDAEGRRIFQGTMKLRGRQRKPQQGETSRFLGYHEILIRPSVAGKNG